MEEVSLQEGMIIEQLTSVVRKELAGEGTGHDWAHVERVHRMARYIAQKEGKPVNMFVVESAALLHDIADWKFHGGDESVGPQRARALMEQFGTRGEAIRRVTAVIEGISFKGAGVATPMETMEGKIVQDADRLDAIGALGIARAFAFGGALGRPLHDPNVSPVQHQSFAQYKREQTTTLNHFYEKLLLLKDRMQTETAKRIAEDRHRFMEQFLNRFYREWESRV